MKVSIQSGNSSISVEGELSEVLEVLSTYWNGGAREAATEESEEIGGSTEKEREGTRRPKKPRSSKKLNPQSKPASGVETRLDANAIANKIKTHARIQEIKEKILDVKADWKNKCLLIAWIADVPINSGDVHRVLHELRIKSTLPALSTALSGNSTDLITQPGPNNSTLYLLTATAKSAFEEFLSKPK